MRKLRVRLASQGRAGECSRKKEQRVWRPASGQKPGTSQDSGDMSFGASWRALCPGVWGHRGVRGRAEGKKNAGNRSQSTWGSWWELGHTGLSKLHRSCISFWENEDHLRGWGRWQTWLNSHFRMLTPPAGQEDGKDTGQTAKTWCKKDNVLPMGVSTQFIHLRQRLAGPRGGLPAHQALPNMHPFPGKVSSLLLPITTPVAKCPHHPRFPGLP